MTSSHRDFRSRLGGAFIALALVACSSSEGSPDAPSAPIVPPAPTPPANTSPAIASTNAHVWLRARMSATGLVDSYQDAQDICYTYDQAVAAIAFQAKGDAASARKVLDGLASLQSTDGSFTTAYFCTSRSVQESQRHVGPVLWVAMAAAYYETRTGDARYHAMGDKAVQWSLRFQQPDGGLNGGLDFNGAALSWASTEHNEDAYSALVSFGQTTSAAKVKDFLDTIAWDSPNQRWFVGRNDPGDPLDVNAWGVSALGATGLPAAYRRGLVHGATPPRQHSDGGVQYSRNGTNNGYWTMSTAKSVSATGWLILAVEGVNPFQP